jgi:lipopolysaccharide export LptBFGC system permease protein LptF
MDDRIRTSDADRDQVTARLRDHYAEGRLTRDELDERITATLSAKTFGELRRVLADLPGSMVTPAMASPPLAMAASEPGRIYRHRHGPRVLPLLLIALGFTLLVSGGGAAAVAVKIVAIAFAVMLGVLMLAAFTAARFVRRARANWYQGHGHYHGHYQSWNWPDGFGPPGRHSGRW